MSTVFITVAFISIIGATAFFIVRKRSDSVLAGNICFAFILIGLLSIGCYAMDVDKLFEKDYSTQYKQINISAQTQVHNNGRPVKKRSQNSTNKNQAQSSDTVYITRRGEKYHLSYSCGGNEYYECTLEQALSRGLSPCKKCAQ